MAHESSKNNLAAWKWEDLLQFRTIYNQQIVALDDVREAVGIKIEDMQMNIDYPDLKNIFIARFNRDMLKGIRYVEVINAEIKRRIAMVGGAV